MTDAKNSLSETTSTSGLIGPAATLTLTGAENTWNPTFQQAFGGAATDIPVVVYEGDSMQTCRVDFNGTTTLTIVSIQSTFEGGTYDDTSPTGITLTGGAVVQCTFNADDFVKIDAHIENFANPHSVTQAQVGLGNVDNTSDADKPISTATQTALDTKIQSPDAANTPGAVTINYGIACTQTIYDGLTPAADTFYFITGP